MTNSSTHFSSKTNTVIGNSSSLFKGYYGSGIKFYIVPVGNIEKILGSNSKCLIKKQYLQLNKSVYYLHMGGNLPQIIGGPFLPRTH